MKKIFVALIFCTGFVATDCAALTDVQWHAIKALGGGAASVGCFWGAKKCYQKSKDCKKSEDVKEKERETFWRRWTYALMVLSGCGAVYGCCEARWCYEDWTSGEKDSPGGPQDKPEWVKKRLDEDGAKGKLLRYEEMSIEERINLVRKVFGEFEEMGPEDQAKFAADFFKECSDTFDDMKRKLGVDSEEPGDDDSDQLEEYVSERSGEDD